jgi:hypothetical protein
MRDNHDHYQDRDRVPDDANGERAIAPTPVNKALTSVAALSAALNSVDTSAVGGRSGLPMMFFKREGSGTYVVGQKKVIVQAGSRWAFNPTTFCWGYVAFAKDNKVHERLVSVSKAKPDVTKLPDVGAEWQDALTVNVKCIDGIDKGLEAIFKASTDGSIKEVMRLLEKVRDRINSGEHDGKIVPIGTLEKDSYQHADFGRVWIPVFEIVGWMTLDGPAAAPSPPPPEPAPAPTKGPTAGGSSAAAEQPRRRRVA